MASTSFFKGTIKAAMHGIENRIAGKTNADFLFRDFAETPSYIEGLKTLLESNKTVAGAEDALKAVENGNFKRAFSIMGNNRKEAGKVYDGYAKYMKNANAPGMGDMIGDTVKDYTLKSMKSLDKDVLEKRGFMKDEQGNLRRIKGTDKQGNQILSDNIVDSEDLSTEDVLSNMYHNSDGTLNKTAIGATVAGSYMGVSAAGRIASGGGLYRDSDGNFDIIGIPVV